MCDGDLRQLGDTIRRNNAAACAEIAKIRNSGRTVLGIESALVGVGDFTFNNRPVTNWGVIETAIYYEEIEHALKCRKCGSMNVPTAEKCKDCGQIFHSEEVRHV